MKPETRERTGPTLASLAPGSEAEVEDVDTNDPIGRRLLSLGLARGTRVKVIQRAPLGDPTLYELRGFQLCLRENEARRVRIRVSK